MKDKVVSNILLVVAHPDDEVLGCGGTIAKHAANGDNVWVLILGEGITSRINLSESKKSQELQKLKKSAHDANTVLGVRKLILKQLPDNKFDSLALLGVVQIIEEVVRDFNPEVIYTHSRGDVNIDHRITTEAVESVIRPVETSSITKVLSFETPSSSEWNFVRPRFAPNIFVELSNKFLTTKIEALKAYSSEVRQFPHPRSFEYLEALAKVRGGQSGFKLAEAFELIFERKSSL